MEKSIIGLLLIGASIAAIASVLSNLMRISEIRSLRRELRRYEKAFDSAKSSIKVIEKYIKDERELPDPIVTLVVKDETKSDDLPKFGDE